MQPAPARMLDQGAPGPVMADRDRLPRMPRRSAERAGSVAGRSGVATSQTAGRSAAMSSGEKSQIMAAG